MGEFSWYDLSPVHAILELPPVAASRIALELHMFRRADSTVVYYWEDQDGNLLRRAPIGEA